MARASKALRRISAGAFGMGELLGILRQMSFDELHDEARVPPRLLLLGSEPLDLVPLRDALGGTGAAGMLDTASFTDIPERLDPYDAIVCVNATPADRARPALKRLLTDASLAPRVLTVQFPPPPPGGTNPLTQPSTAALDDLRRRLLTRLPHRQLALGRWLPGFRREATIATINSTARANAEFALLANLPALIPLVGGLISAGADTLVLTKNQLMMLYKLAAIHNRDLSQPWRLYTEMVPVVGAGLLWRTLAREAASFVPFAGGTIPKVVIAYAGTAVAGQAASYYYEFGEKPSAEQLKRFSRRAYEIARGLKLPNRSETSDAIDVQFIERTARPGALSDRDTTGVADGQPAAARSGSGSQRVPLPDGTADQHG